MGRNGNKKVMYTNKLKAISSILKTKSCFNNSDNKQKWENEISAYFPNKQFLKPMRRSM